MSELTAFEQEHHKALMELSERFSAHDRLEHEERALQAQTIKEHDEIMAAHNATLSKLETTTAILGEKIAATSQSTCERIGSLVRTLRFGAWVAIGTCSILGTLLGWLAVKWDNKIDRSAEAIIRLETIAAENRHELIRQEKFDREIAAGLIEALRRLEKKK